MNQELESLTQQYMDGTLEGPGMARLNALLLQDPVSRRDFAEFLNMDSALAALAAGGQYPEMPGEKIPAASAPPAFRPASATFRWLAAAACLLVLGLSGTWWLTNQQDCAVVNSATGDGSLEPGVTLRMESHVLRQGTLSLTTALGARVVIEAPASFRFESPQRLRMVRGRLAADVPPSAKGFTVVTPTGEAIDLGTRFGVDVPDNAPAEIHVFEGEVIARSQGEDAKKSIRTGGALSMNKDGSASRDLRTAAFIQADEIPRLQAGLAAGQRARAEAALQELRKDPALIALLDFESSPPLDKGVFRTVQGRWPGSHAPEFIHVGDHLKLDAGGDRNWPQLTLAAWVRIDRLGEPYQSLLHTDGWSRANPGQVHWIITRETTMRLALIGNTLAAGSDEQYGFPDSRTPVLREQGRWVHLAVVYDSEKRTVRFFLNGRFDKETRQDTAHPARLGPAQIGNWDLKDRKLSGRVDELLILGRAMTDGEILTLHAAGNPYAE